VSAAPAFSVVVPTRGDARKLAALFTALETQTLARERFEVVLALDGAPLPAETAARLAQLGGRALRLEERRGPGAARNAGAAAARHEWLAFTEDDCVPRPDWLERAAARIEDAALPAPDAIEGVTEGPGGRPLRHLLDASLQYLPTTLFVKREWFGKVGGYCERFYEPARGVYFREDADFGFALEAAGAVSVRAPQVRVMHPAEHGSFLDPLRWAARYEMDALLAARHPRRFRERIEVHRLGPLRIRRPIVRACVAAVVAALLALAALAAGQPAAALAPGIVYALVCGLLWAKWRFAPLRLAIVPLVPFAMSLALLRGRSRAAAWQRDPRGGQ
jgi:glycosyltransferase involved in cell wall biosynthesis